MLSLLKPLRSRACISVERLTATSSCYGVSREDTGSTFIGSGRSIDALLPSPLRAKLPEADSCYDQCNFRYSRRPVSGPASKMYGTHNEETLFSSMNLLFNALPRHLTKQMACDFQDTAWPIRLNNFSRYSATKLKLTAGTQFASKEVRLRISKQLKLLMLLTEELKLVAENIRVSNKHFYTPYLPAAITKLVSILSALHHVDGNPGNLANVAGEVYASHAKIISLAMCGVRDAARNMADAAADYTENNATQQVDLEKVLFKRLNELLHDFLILSISAGVISKQFYESYRRLSFNTPNEVDLRNLSSKTTYKCSYKNSYDATNGSVGGYGFVDEHCNIYDIVCKTNVDACKLCTAHYNVHPNLKLLFIEGNKENPHLRMFLPGACRYILLELLKNSISTTLCKVQYRRGNNANRPQPYSEAQQALSGSSLPPVYCIVKCDDNGVWIRVSDFGEGMSKETLDNIRNCISFSKMRHQAYFRIADSSIRGTSLWNDKSHADMNGYGIGVAISSAFVHYLQGSLLYYSNEGVGTDSYVYLPVLNDALHENLPYEKGNDSSNELLLNSIHRKKTEVTRPPEDLVNLDILSLK